AAADRALRGRQRGCDHGGWAVRARDGGGRGCMSAASASESRTESANVSLHMVREEMENIPEYSLPPGYRFRPYREGDAATWTAIQRAAEPFFAIEDDLFERQYGPMADALPERMVFVETSEGEAVASISAWWETSRDNPNDRGRIHWVVVHP